MYIFRQDDNIVVAEYDGNLYEIPWKAEQSIKINGSIIPFVTMAGHIIGKAKQE